MSPGPTRHVCVVVFASAGLATSRATTAANPARRITGATLSTIRPAGQGPTPVVDHRLDMSNLCRSALLAVFLMVAAPSAALAADVSTTGATRTFVALEGEANQLTVTLATGTYTLTDAGGAPITAGANCTQITPSQATCPAAGITLLTLDGRDRNDTILVGSGTAAATITGGAGDDVLTGGDGNDTLNGGTHPHRL